ncbi:MAG: hypothetical protein QME96_18855, partial [Myxococcota bacterium]|nr:hypothetical protein [Myxococcota bacterium]
MRRTSRLAVLAVLPAAFGCTEPPRPVREHGGQQDPGSRAVATTDAEARPASLTTVPPVEADGDAGDPHGVMIPPGPDAGATEPAPELTPEELFEIQYPLHALVIAGLSPVYHKPDSGSARLGYLRKGGRMRVGLKIERGRGCVGGNWYPLPEKGFVCSTSLRVDVVPPQSLDVPIMPDRSAAVPYRYGLNRQRRAFALSRLPAAEELAGVRAQRDSLIRRLLVVAPDQ